MLAFQQDTDGPANREREDRAHLHGEKLLALTDRLCEPLTMDEVARIIVDQAVAAAGAFTAAMWTVDDPPTHATLQRSIGYDTRVRERFERIPLEPALPIADAMLRREALFFESRSDYHARYPVAEERSRDLPDFRELSYACLPLVVHGRAIAGVSLLYQGVHVFEQDERGFLTILARHAAQALERARLFEREKVARERLERLQQLTAALSSVAGVEEVARLATIAGAEALNLPASAMWVVDDRGDLRLLAAYGVPQNVVAPFRHVDGGSGMPAARVASGKQPVWFERESDLEGEHPSITAALGQGDAFRAYSAMPLVHDGQVLGVLSFSADHPRAFPPDERAFMSTIAAQCADALARARLYDHARRMERRLQSVLEHLPVGVVVAPSRDLGLAFVNEAVAHIWRAGPIALEAIDRYSAFRAFHPDGRAVGRDEWPGMRALRGEHIQREELRIERKDGSKGWVQITAAPIHGDDGEIEMAVSTVVDVTAEKVARATAEEASRAKDEFLAMLGHELRNPLAPIVTALHLMKLRGDGAFEHERAVIQRQVSHLTRLVDDLLDVSRALRGTLRLDRTQVELAHIVTAAIEVALPLLEERRHRVTLSVPQNGLTIDADAQRLTQVVANLLSNAAKYTPPGGHVAVSAHAEGEQVILDVTDNGSGIGADLLPRIFDAFTQGRRALDRKEGGLGLGLAIARQLIVGHGGAIEARSAGEGLGTTITVRLPRASEPSVVQARPLAGPAGLRPAVRRVLIVDDNPDAAALLEEALSDAGHDVRTAPDGPTALQLAESFAPEIAFLDIGLPVMDGYELAVQLRSLRLLAGAPLVAMTGYAQPKDRERALAHGFAEHLAKPLDPERVLECIERLRPAAPYGG